MINKLIHKHALVMQQFPKNSSIDLGTLHAASVSSKPFSAFEPHVDTLLRSQSDPLRQTQSLPPSASKGEKPEGTRKHRLNNDLQQTPSIDYPFSPTSTDTVRSVAEIDSNKFPRESSDPTSRFSISTSNSRQRSRSTSRSRSRSANRSRSTSRSGSSTSKTRHRVSKRPPPISTSLTPHSLPSILKVHSPISGGQSERPTVNEYMLSPESYKVSFSPKNFDALPLIPTSKFSPGLLSPDLTTPTARYESKPLRGDTTYTFASSDYSPTASIAPVERLPMYTGPLQTVNLSYQPSLKRQASSAKQNKNEPKTTQKLREAQTKDPESIIQPAALPTVRIEQANWPPKGIRPLTIQSLDYERTVNPSPTSRSAPSHTRSSSRTQAHVVSQIRPMSNSQSRPLQTASTNIPRRSRYSHLFDKPLPTPPLSSAHEIVTTTPSSKQNTTQKELLASSHRLPYPDSPPRPEHTAHASFSRTNTTSYPPQPRTPARSKTTPAPRPQSTGSSTKSSPTKCGQTGLPAITKTRTRSTSDVSELSYVTNMARGRVNSVVSAMSPFRGVDQRGRGRGAGAEWDLQSQRESLVSPLEGEFPASAKRRK